MSMNFHGTAPRNSAIELRDINGMILATGEANGAGNWDLKGIKCAPGAEVVCVAMRQDGESIESQPTTVPVEEIDDSAEVVPQDIAATQRAQALYQQLVEASAEGFEIDSDSLCEVMDLAGYDVDDFIRDRDSLVAVNATLANPCAALERGIESLLNTGTGDLSERN